MKMMKMNDPASTLDTPTASRAHNHRPWWWHVHRLSGVSIIFLLGFHVFFVMAEKGSTISSIQQRVAQLGYVIVDTMMLLIVLFHALNGLRLIFHGILERWYTHRQQYPNNHKNEQLERWKQFVTIALILSGVVLAIYGVSFMMVLSLQPSS